MEANPLRVLIVDDSVIARKMISDALAAVANVVVVATASGGRIALRKLDAICPDVAIVDLEMPEIDGIQLIRMLRASRPLLRVLIHTSNGAMAERRAIEALTEGADDVLPKPVLAHTDYETQLQAIRDRLVPKLLQFQRKLAPRDATGVRTARSTQAYEAVAIGVSTGGPEALRHLFAAMPGDYPLPILVVQHMPPGFTRALATRLDQTTPLHVCEAEDGQAIEGPGVWVAPGGQHLAVERSGERIQARLSFGPPENSCRPAADVLMRSAADVWGARLITLVMTGMGSDGTRGARYCRAQGGLVLAQDQPSSVVWGMPGSVVEAGLADAVGDIEALAGWLQDAARGRALRSSL